MRIAYLTAGAAGMYCGSCMHDNALARALQRKGVDCVLLPIYTPIRTDEQDVSSEQLFFGGINLFLLEQLPVFRWVPPAIRRWLDSPRLLKWVSGRAAQPSDKMLGRLTVSMLRGLDGPQASEAKRLASWLREELQPEVVLLSNFLIGGVLPAIRKSLPDASLVVTLQGDDIFIDYLKSPYREQVIEEMKRLVPIVDRFIVHSQFYADKMSAMLDIPQEKIGLLPLAIDVQHYADSHSHPQGAGDGTLSEGENQAKKKWIDIGFLARLAPEKGLHHLVAAFLEMLDSDAHLPVRLHVAGWQGPQHDSYVNDLQQQLERAGAGDRFRFHGSPDLAGKKRFLEQLDILSVPTDYADPKGLFVLEAWAVGLPVVQPSHGAFSELLAKGQGGLLFPPGDVPALVTQLRRLASSAEERDQLGVAGRAYVIEQGSIEYQATELLKLLEALKS